MIGIFVFCLLKRYNMGMDKENQKISEKKKFSIISRLRSSDNAWRGLGVMIRTSHNSWWQIFCAILAVYLGFILKISFVEWALIVFAFGIVIITETINSAIEVDVDLTTSVYHPFARDAKDISAGAVLLTCFLAGIIGALVFGPKLIALLL